MWGVLMKRLFTISILFFIVYLSAYSIGDTVSDLSWTDNNGEYHSVHELIDSGRVILFFWGESW